MGFASSEISGIQNFPISAAIEFLIENTRSYYAAIFSYFTEEVVHPTDAPVPKKKYVSGKLTLNNEKYMKEYGNKESKQFKNMANRIETAVIANCGNS